MTHKGTYQSATGSVADGLETMKKNGTAPRKAESMTVSEARTGRHCLRPWVQTSGEWRSGRKNPCEAMRTGIRTAAITVLWYQAASSMPTIRRWQLSVFSIAHRRGAVKGCQCLHRHLLTA